MPITIRELKPVEIPAIFPLICEHNPWMTKPLFTRALKEMLPGGYRVAAAFDGKTMLGCSGFWLRTRFWCGKQIDIDNFIVTETARGKNIGKKLTAWLEKKAKAEQCELMVLDSYVTSNGAHSFYYKQGFVITGYHLTKMPGSQTPGTLPYATLESIKHR